MVAFFSKFAACFAAAIGTGFNWREAGAIGSLMSCKGYALQLKGGVLTDDAMMVRLVELIVLNIGLQAGILDTRGRYTRLWFKFFTEYIF